MPDPALWQGSMFSTTGALGRNLGGLLGAHRADLRWRGQDAHGGPSLIVIEVSWSLSNHFEQRGCPPCGPDGDHAHAAQNDAKLDEHRVGGRDGSLHDLDAGGGETTVSPGPFLPESCSRLRRARRSWTTGWTTGGTTGRIRPGPPRWLDLSAPGPGSAERDVHAHGTAVIDGRQDEGWPSPIGVEVRPSFVGVPGRGTNDAAGHSTSTSPLG